MLRQVRSVIAQRRLPWLPRGPALPGERRTALLTALGANNVAGAALLLRRRGFARLEDVRAAGLSLVLSSSRV